MKKPEKPGKYGYLTSGDLPRYFHLENSGFERRIIFSSQEDYDRFEAYLYLLNAVESARAANFFVGNRRDEIFSSARGERLIAIGAYSFLAREFHILATPLVENGISKFMQKLQTAYTMYFNRKYQRSGRLFQASYQSREVAEQNVVRVFAEIHLNPAELFDTSWQSAGAAELQLLTAKALQYRYSSAGEFLARKYIIADPEPFPKKILQARDADFYAHIWNRLKRDSAE
ncbi:MAG: hypothetical protein WA021_00730 [Minisyncoccia bacterium]